MKSVFKVGLLSTSLLASIILVAAPSAAAPEEPVTAIVGAIVFDGTGAAPRPATVLITGDRITAVGADLKVPGGAEVIDAKGKALLPGFFDVHTHWTPSGSPGTTPQIATAYVQSGVTTVNDFHQQPESYAPRREWLSNLVAPHVNFAARVSTPGGHGADWGDQNTTVTFNTPDGAKAAVERLKPYKPDFIKAFTDGWRYGNAPDNTSMDEGTLRALVTSAHEAGLEVVTHTVTVERGAAAARAGIDALAHGLQDRQIDPAALQQIVAAKTAMAPTLAVYEPDKGGKPGDPNDPRYQQTVRKFGYALQNVKTLYDAGVPIGLGTDAGMPGTTHGKSTLHEMELLVKAGLTPAQALQAGTLTSAKIMRLDGDRGTIEPGKRADLVLIDGRPWVEISDVYKVNRVIIDGRLVHGEGAPALPVANRATRLESVKVAALIDDFERADGRTALDTLRLETPDGGIDRSVEITQVVPRGDNGHALQLSAKLAVKEKPYAGVAFPLTRGSVRPADLSGAKGLRFDLKGAGDYTLRFTGPDGVWEGDVKGGREWQTIEMPFTALRGTAREGEAAAWTGAAVTLVEIGSSRRPGERLSFEVDNLAFY